MFFKRKKEVIDLTKRDYGSRDIARLKASQTSQNSSSPTPSSDSFSFFSSIGATAKASSDSSSTGGYVDAGSIPESGNFGGDEDDKRRKLAKRLIDMTSKIEDLDNQIYHLKQRIEVLERKAGVSEF